MGPRLEHPDEQTVTSQGGITSSWRWLLGLFTIAGFVEVAFWGQMSAFTPGYLPHLGVASGDVRIWTGVIVAAASGIGIPFLPLWGALADRYSRQPIIVRSYVAHIVAGILAILAGNVWVFLLARSVMSFALGNSGLMMTTLSERAPPARLGLAFSVMNGAQPLGAFLGPLLGGPIVDAWGFRALIEIDLVLLVAIAAGLTFGYRDAYTPTVRAPVLLMAIETVALMWRDRRLQILFPALFLLFAGWMLAFTYLPLVVTSLYTGSDPGRVVGIVFGVGGLSTLVLSPAIGWLSDRFGYWRSLFAGSLLSVVLWPLPALTRDLLVFTLLWAVLTGLVSGVFALSFTVLSSSVREDIRGRVMSFSFLPANIGLTLGPAIGSVVTRWSVFAVFPVAMVFTGFGVLMLVPAYRRAMSS
ncbi:MAG: multidrug efflux MFS transporter [Chloroflexota bacterium]